MKVLLIIMALFFIGCSGEDDKFWESDNWLTPGYYDEVTTRRHYQSCYFPFSATIQWDTLSINVNAGDTIELPSANKYWYYVDADKRWVFLDIDLGEEVRWDTTYSSTRHAEYEHTDSVIIHVYHDGVSEVSVK